MNFTFGIITSEESNGFLPEIVRSIEENNIPVYEIIIVGKTEITGKNITVIPFDETVKKGWITRKKNIIVEQAKYENVVLLHDYIKLNEGWYDGFLKFGSNYDWCVSKILTMEGNRFRDYTLFPMLVPWLNILYSPGYCDEYFKHNCLLPYDFENCLSVNKYMYISGSYYIIKKHIATVHKLNENLLHCGGEDVEYSKRLHNNGIIIKANQWSSVSFLKHKGSCRWEHQISDEKMDMFLKWSKTAV